MPPLRFHWRLCVLVLLPGLVLPVRAMDEAQYDAAQEFIAQAMLEAASKACPALDKDEFPDTVEPLSALKQKQAELKKKAEEHLKCVAEVQEMPSTVHWLPSELPGWQMATLEQKRALLALARETRARVVSELSSAVEPYARVYRLYEEKLEATEKKAALARLRAESDDDLFSACADEASQLQVDWRRFEKSRDLHQITRNATALAELRPLGRELDRRTSAFKMRCIRSFKLTPGAKEVCNHPAYRSEWCDGFL